MLTETGGVDSWSDYYQFGKESRGSATSNEPKEQFAGNQRDFEIDLDYLGARYYNADIGRFSSVDRFSSKVPNLTSYNYAQNNPIRFIDINGDSAWAINNKWNSETINKYRSYATKKADEYAKSGEKATCEDFALNILIDFASENGLPLSIANGTGTLDAASNDFSSVDDFKEAVTNTTGASDLQNDQNTKQIDMNNLKVGDLLLLRDNGKTANHTQFTSWVVESRNGGLRQVGITQGNSSWIGSSNRNSPLYIGTTVERGIIDVTYGNYYNISTGRTETNYVSKHNIEARTWNFKGWNK